MSYWPRKSSFRADKAEKNSEIRPPSLSPLYPQTLNILSHHPLNQKHYWVAFTSATTLPLHHPNVYLCISNIYLQANPLALINVQWHRPKAVPQNEWNEGRETGDQKSSLPTPCVRPPRGVTPTSKNLEVSPNVEALHVLSPLQQERLPAKESTGILGRQDVPCFRSANHGGRFSQGYY